MTTTIAAIASPPGGGPRGIVRISGSHAREIVAATFTASPPPDLSRRGLKRGRFRDGRGEQPALLLWMPGPRSFTREDVAELHLPGSPPLLRAALERVLAAGAVLAGPGEFTRRAFLSGRIDLTRAEGVLALVSARDASELRAGHALLAGGLADRVQALRDGLADLRALVEAGLDFDERDTGHVAREEIRRGLDVARTRLFEAQAWESRRISDSGEPRVVLAGAPNAGKSALFNRLAGAEHALVSAYPGTTRDALSVRLEQDGIAFRLWDTAGIARAAPGPEREAQGSARATRAAADFVLWVVDASSASSASLLREQPSLPETAPRLLVWNKTDRSDAAPAPPLAPEPWIGVSARLGTGVEALRARVGEELRRVAAGSARDLGARHRAALIDAAAHVEAGRALLESEPALELLAEHLRAAVDALDDVAGKTTAEDVLDRIFARFCLGK